MTKPTKRILSGDSLQGLCQSLLQGLMRSGPETTQECLDLGEGLFNGRVIGRIGWQEERLTAMRLDELAHLCPFMNAQIVQHHDLPSRQTGGQDLFHIGFRGHDIDRSLDDYRGTDAGKRQRSEEGRMFPTIARC